jgi:hypothetical protein
MNAPVAYLEIAGPDSRKLRGFYEKVFGSFAIPRAT